MARYFSDRATLRAAHQSAACDPPHSASIAAATHLHNTARLKPKLFIALPLARRTLQACLDELPPFDDAAVEQSNRSLRTGRKAAIVSYHDDRGAPLMQLPEELHDGFSVSGVEVPGWLVGEQNGGIAGERTRDGHALLLATGKLGRKVLTAMRDVH
jgi:hypothetical protein